MQPESRQPEISSPEQNTLSQSDRKRRTSDRSIRAVPERSEPSNAPATARRTVTRNSPQLGSSREMTPSEELEAIKYTRTGRVSRANKGKRVHHCEECGKVRCLRSHLMTSDCDTLSSQLRPEQSLSPELRPNTRQASLTASRATKKLLRVRTANSFPDIHSR